MKESTYGWYPSVRDVYRPKGRPSSYHAECLYKYGDSLYYQGHVAPPEGELFVRGMSQTPPRTPCEIRRQRAKSVIVPKFTPVPKLHIPTVLECWATQKIDRKLPETTWGLIDDSGSHQQLYPTQSKDVNWPLPKKKVLDQQKLHEDDEDKQHQQMIKEHLQQKYGKTSPSTPPAWGLKNPTQEASPRSVASTKSDVTWPVAKNPLPDRPQTASGQMSERVTTKERQMFTGQVRPFSSPTKPRTPAASKPVTARPAPAKVAAPAVAAIRPKTTRSASPKKPNRVQSATVRREKTPLPSRPVTACASRQQQHPLDQQVLPTPPVPECPPAPVPFVYDVNDAQVTIDEDELAQKLSDLGQEDYDYEQVREKYGWRAEVHGNPFGLKKPTQRLSYVIKSKEPEVPPPPPNVHSETNEPFFYNTIPHKPATFSVHKEWMSEILMAKRLELQKRQGGVKYDYKRFAFVY